MAGVRGWRGVAGSHLGFFGSKPARTPRQGHNGPTTQALLVEGHTKDEPSSPAARPGDPLSTASDSSERRSPARDAGATADSGSTGDSGRSRDFGGTGGSRGTADSGGSADRAPSVGRGGSGPVIGGDAQGGGCPPREDTARTAPSPPCEWSRHIPDAPPARL